MRFLLLPCACVLLAGSLGRCAEPIQPQHLNKLLALIKPQSNEEKWTQIPWMTNLWEARKKAAAEGKPILLWEMDGNPLGCV